MLHGEAERKGDTLSPFLLSDEHQLQADGGAALEERGEAGKHWHGVRVGCENGIAESGRGVSAVVTTIVSVEPAFVHPGVGGRFP
jgi:hypothetical protein